MTFPRERVGPSVDSYRFLSGITKRMVKSWIKMEQPREIPWHVRNLLSRQVPG
ncbi:MAG: hypothetical protein ACK2U9_18395 [Anaerolineae bacterium]|jgi:hypothetical protein